MRYRVLIVDDEPLACERLRAWLHEEPSVEIAGECGSGSEAVAALRNTPVDLVFLDMEMPGCNGLQALAQLPGDNRPAVIFATAHERFAVGAFEVQAVDYLLKPFDRERFQLALQRALDRIRTQRAGDLAARMEAIISATAPAQRPERLMVKADGRMIFLKPKDIIWVEADNNYSTLHLTSTKRLMVRETLSSMETQLGAADFARINRSALVQLDQVLEMCTAKYGDYTVLLRNGVRLPLSRSLRGRFERFVTVGLPAS